MSTPRLPLYERLPEIYRLRDAGQSPPGQLEAYLGLIDEVLRAVRDARVMLVGGEPLDGPRFMWWNFVSSSRERIEQAKADWRDGRLGAVPGETEFIPLPDH